MWIFKSNKKGEPDYRSALVGKKYSTQL